MRPLTIGKVAKLTGIGVETVRFYEKSGLIDEPPRSKSGYRQFPASTVARVRFIKRAKELGFTLNEIKGLLHLKLNPTTSCDEVRHMAEEKRMNVRAKIESLRGIERALDALISACSASGPTGECPFLEALEPEWELKKRKV
ncbi:MAG: MerR family DNA-binding protein [bacterium]